MVRNTLAFIAFLLTTVMSAQAEDSNSASESSRIRISPRGIRVKISGDNHNARWELDIFSGDSDDHGNRHRQGYNPGFWRYNPGERRFNYPVYLVGRDGYIYPDSGMIVDMPGWRYRRPRSYWPVVEERYHRHSRNVFIIDNGGGILSVDLPNAPYLKALVPVKPEMTEEKARSIIDNSHLFEQAKRCSLVIGDLVKVVKESKDEKIVQDALRRLTEIDISAQKQFELAKQMLAEKKDVEFVKLIDSVIRDFKGLKISDEASDWFYLLRSKDKEIAARVKVARMEIKAAPYFNRAVKYEKDGRFDTAINFYRKIVAEMPESEYGRMAKERLEELGSDPALKKFFEDTDVVKDCRGWLSLANTYLDSGLYDKAREYAENVIKSYPESTFAEEARELLKRISKKQAKDKSK